MHTGADFFGGVLGRMGGWGTEAAVVVKKGKGKMSKKPAAAKGRSGSASYYKKASNGSRF